MTWDRHLEWDGCFNARDLGGLRTVGGQWTRRGAVVRSDAPDRLTAAGWDALWEYGIRTVIDLRNDGELKPDTTPRPVGLHTLHMPLDGSDDAEFWGYWGKRLHGTPLYYQPFLERFPRRAAAVVSAVAQARPGGVLIHCAVGRDRTGIVTLLLLALAGVPAETIVADHALSTERLRPAFAALGVPDQGPIIEELLARKNTTGQELVRATLAWLNVDDYLREAGLGENELVAARARLLAE